jgi:ArsR family transcriptional regulator
LSERIYFDIIGNMEIKQAVKALAALAQETRLSVFRMLVEAGEAGMSAGELAGQLEVPAATLSFHLKELATSELIEQSRNGRSLIYSLRPGVMNELLQFLMEDCCQGRPELCQPDFSPIGCQDQSCGDKSRRRLRNSSN